MNREEVIRMAREAGFDEFNGLRDDDTTSVYYEAWPEQLERFFQAAYAAGAAAEREACAKVCDEIAKLPNDLMSDAPHIAAAIRARGQA